MQKARPDAEADRRAAALTTAALDCALKLGLSPADTAALLGVPQGAFAAMKKGERAVDGMNGEAERADALVRAAKKLRALLGEAETNWRAWLRRESPELGAKPIDLMRQRDGILQIAAFLQARSTLS
jgi:hypothetical protein